VNAKAPAAAAQEPLSGPNWAGIGSTAPAEALLDSASRARAALLATALGALAFAAATAVALLIATGPFHTSLGSLA
jgi:hypothetical protein